MHRCGFCFASGGYDVGGEYLEFIFTNDTSNVIPTVSYGTLRSGLIKVIARAQPPQIAVASLKSTKTASHPRKTQSSSVTTDGYQIGFPQGIVRIVTIADATKFGTDTMYVRPEIKILALPDSIEPLYPRYVDSSLSRTNVKVAVTVSGKIFLAAPYRVEVTSAAVDSSGGHSHTQNRPSGYFVTTSGDTVKQQDFDTGPDTIRTVYQASMFGGKERIIAKILSLTPTIADTDTVVVRVPNLISFPRNSNYQLPPNRDTLHPNNHYLLQGAINDLVDAANGFQNEEWNTSGIMNLNDMSLQSGGLFDIYHTWIPPHRAHRLGKSVDIANIIKQDTTGSFIIRRNNSDTTITGTFTIANVIWLRDFIDFMAEYNWAITIEEGQFIPNPTSNQPKGQVPYPHFEWGGN